MNDALLSALYDSEFFSEIEGVVEYVLNLLSLPSEQRVMVESLVGNVMDKAYLKGHVDRATQDFWEKLGDE